MSEGSSAPEEDPLTAEVSTDSSQAWVALRTTVPQKFVAFAWFLVASVFATWPLARFVASRAPSNIYDPLENAWIFGWGAHALVHRPLHLFSANIFNPERLTLAYAENMLGLSLPVAPVFWLTHNAVLTMNVAAILIFATGSFGVFLLACEFGAPPLVAVVVGTAAGLTPYRIAAIGHLHVIATHATPYILLLLVRLRHEDDSRSATRRRVLILSALIGYEFWASLTGGVVALVAISGWLAWALVTQRRIAFRLIRRAFVAMCIGAALAAPVLVPYLIVRSLHPDYNHPASEVLMFSARPGSYLYPPLAGPVAERLDPHLRSVVSKSGGAERDVFPGSWLLAASVAGAAVGIVSAARRRPAPGIWLGVAIAGAGFVFSLGPRWSGRPGGLPLPFFALAHAAGGLTRVPARLAMAVPIGLALMAAGALTVIPSTIRRVVAAASLILVLVEVAPSAVPMVLVPTISGAHRRLAARPGVILDLPMAELDANGALIPLTVPREAIQMYLSTANFRPLINGYGAFQPPSYWSLALALQDFPTSTALQALRSRDVRTVVAQTDLLPGTRWAHVVEQLKAWPGVREIDRGTNVVVYDISDAR